ncbi:PREDICTED: protein DOWNY MILDEW RESISTANCE 6-like [Camelina sativa]|uniref:Protein DOWNY MILDEW RESISTANCE 6-like n=1 Tax=Camelina sativa TaxID=90675 RepID=A0ABM0SMX6_CAMSA|nr:PREDICTED: protein DOWNY MILDEW RESISTANCE 6-like [Camelina sativa]
MEETNKSVLDDCFTSAMALTESGVLRVPTRYILPPSQRPMLGSSSGTDTITLPVIDLSLLHDPLLRPCVIHEIKMACKGFGFFQIINHGISSSVVKDALDAATKFFDLPVDEKMLLGSDNVHTPVRYGTSFNHSTDKVHYWRDFIKHYSHPLSKWIDLWPSNPQCYKEKVGKYAEAAHVLHKQLIEAISESLGLEKNYLEEEIEEGSQVMAVNCYPACPEPDIALGMPPHSDFGSLTILLQSSQGLQIMDSNNNWVSVPYIEGALIVQLGDQVEVMSNGIYKSVVHRVTVNKDFKRLSFASLHSLPMHKKISPASQLVNENKSAAYGEFSFNDFLDYISSNDITQQRFIDTLRKNKF